MEIVLKMNNRIETMTVNFSNLNSSSSSMCPINMQELQDAEDDPSPQNQSPTPDEETSVQETMTMLKEREQRLQVCTIKYFLSSLVYPSLINQDNQSALSL